MNEVKKDVKPEETPAVEPSTPPEVVPSAPEVKPAQPQVIEPGKGKSVEEQQAQIDNLNIALKEERESRKQDKGKIDELTAKLTESIETMEKLKGVFVPKETPSDETPPIGLTRNELDSWWQEKEQEREQKTQEQKRAELIQNEIKDLEKEFDGSAGKPKYDDREVLQWQKDNDKLYLTPKEAFSVMKKNEIIDYEVKRRQEGKPPVENVEQPPSAPGSHEPTPDANAMDEQATRRAVEEALNAVGKEM